MRRMRAWRQDLTTAQAAGWAANGAAGADLRDFRGKHPLCLQLEAQLVKTRKEGKPESWACPTTVWKAVSVWVGG